MLGPFINSAGIVTGSLLGVACSKNISVSFRTKLNTVFSCITLGIGVFMLTKGHSLPPVIIAVLLGALIGEALRIEAGVMRLALGAVDVFHRKKSGPMRLPDQTFRDQFAVLTVLFCASGLGIMGPMQEGVSGDPSLLLIKAMLDFFTAMLFAANIGGIIGVLAVPQCLLQVSIFMGAEALVPLITPTMMGDFSACGGIIMLGAGLRQSGLIEVPILSMLPGLLLVLPLSAVWAHFFGA